jgi:hypothetical protein
VQVACGKHRGESVRKTKKSLTDPSNRPRSYHLPVLERILGRESPVRGTMPVRDS